MPKETIMSKISNEDFELLVKESSSIREVATKCGYSNNSGASSDIVKKRIQKQGIDISHFQRPERIIRNDEEIFVEDSPVNQTTLRRRYFLGEYTPYVCAICGQEPLWQGKELTLILDHINGHNHDDRLENLRWVCPNCNQQLDTFGGKNRRAERNIISVQIVEKKFCYLQQDAPSVQQKRTVLNKERLKDLREKF